MYDPDRIELPPNFLPAHPFDNGELEIRDEKLAPKPLVPATLRQHLADYYGMISHQDEQLKRVLTALRASGAEENTIIVYVSDHGLALGRHGLLGKQNLYEHSVRVPMLLSGPGIAAGVICREMVYSLDLYATLAGLAGHSGRSRPRQPESARCRWRAAPQRGRDLVFALYKDCQRMACDGRWKLIRYRVKGRERLQLFDLAQDPDELNDLSAEPRRQAELERLRSQLAEWQRTIGDRWMPVEPEHRPLAALSLTIGAEAMKRHSRRAFLKTAGSSLGASACSRSWGRAGRKPPKPGGRPISCSYFPTNSVPTGVP